MKKLLNIALCTLVLAGCSDFLDINPKYEVTDKDMFTSAEGYEDALYGVYGEMGDIKSLYGENMSMVFPEICAWNLLAGMSSTWQQLANANWDHMNSRGVFDDIWKNGYIVIGHVNNIINHLDNDKPDFPNVDLYRGEAHALRAFLHFDLLRTFAAPYDSDNAALQAKAIPYVKNYSYALTGYSSVKDAYAKVLEDLSIAEANLARDAQLVQAVRTNAADGFTSCRAIHLNLYAVKALRARVCWTMGDMANAAKYAREVIDSEKFPLMTAADFNNFESGAIHMKETIFGLYSTVYMDKSALHLRYNTGTKPLRLDQEVLDLYGDTGNGTDRRVRAWFDPEFLYLTKQLNKASLSSGSTGAYSGSAFPGWNAIRIPEMYYIVAEAFMESDPSLAMQYFDKVIESRGMQPFAERPAGTITPLNIYEERRKEFIGEGQHWFNMKRLKRSIQNGSMVIPGTDETYMPRISKSLEDDLRTN